MAAEGNILADYLSRVQASSHDWTLDDIVFHCLCHRWGTPWMDIFASEINTKCSIYCSWVGIGHHSLRDAFMTSWSQNLLFMFPPIPRIQKMVVKIHLYNTDAILVAPWWLHKLWFSALWDRELEFVCLLLIPYLLSQHHGKVFHPDLESLHLTAWRIPPQ